MKNITTQGVKYNRMLHKRKRKNVKISIFSKSTQKILALLLSLTKTQNEAKDNLSVAKQQVHLSKTFTLSHIFLSNSSNIVRVC